MVMPCRTRRGGVMDREDTLTNMIAMAHSNAFANSVSILGVMRFYVSTVTQTNTQCSRINVVTQKHCLPKALECPGN